MRKSIFTGMRTLLAAARVSLYTKGSPVAKSKFELEPFKQPEAPARTHGLDDWMFDAEVSLERQTSALASEMSTLSDSLNGLREALALFTGETVFPLEATTQRPCNIVHHDSDLFDGEVMPEPPVQDTTIGGEAAFLFGDAPSFDDVPAQHAA